MLLALRDLPVSSRSPGLSVLSMFANVRVKAVLHHVVYRMLGKLSGGRNQYHERSSSSSFQVRDRFDLIWFRVELLEVVGLPVLTPPRPYS